MFFLPYPFSGTEEGVAKLRVRRFSGLFWPNFHSFLGVNIRYVDINPQKRMEIGLKRTRKTTEPSFATPSEVKSSQSAGSMLHQPIKSKPPLATWILKKHLRYTSCTRRSENLLIKDYFFAYFNVCLCENLTITDYKYR